MSCVSVRVVVALDVVVSENWGEDCPVSQIKKQASLAALELIEKTIGHTKTMKMTGEPKVTIFIDT